MMNRMCGFELRCAALLLASPASELEAAFLDITGQGSLHPSRSRVVRGVVAMTPVTAPSQQGIHVLIGPSRWGKMLKGPVYAEAPRSEELG